MRGVDVCANGGGQHEPGRRRLLKKNLLHRNILLWRRTPYNTRAHRDRSMPGPLRPGCTGHRGCAGGTSVAVGCPRKIFLSAPSAPGAPVRVRPTTTPLTALPAACGAGDTEQPSDVGAICSCANPFCSAAKPFRSCAKPFCSCANPFCSHAKTLCSAAKPIRSHAKPFCSAVKRDRSAAKPVCSGAEQVHTTAWRHRP